MWRMGLWTQWGRKPLGEWRSSINIYTLSGVRWIAGEKLPSSTGSPVWPPVMTERDPMGEGGCMYDYG